VSRSHAFWSGWIRPSARSAMMFGRIVAAYQTIKHCDWVPLIVEEQLLTLGGYTTWRACSSSLEVKAEPEICAVILQLLAKVAGKRRDEPLVASP
jgi:hypothetical protein